MTDASAVEKYSTISQLARRLHVDPKVARRMFEREPGVINAGTGQRLHLRVPESAVQRVIQRRQVTFRNAGRESSESRLQ